MANMKSVEKLRIAWHLHKMDSQYLDENIFYTWNITPIRETIILRQHSFYIQKNIKIVFIWK